MVEFIDRTENFLSLNAPPPERERSGFSDALGAALRTETAIGSIFAQEYVPSVYRPEVGIDDLFTIEEIDALPSRFQPYRERFMHVTRQDAEIVKRNIDREIQDRDTLAHANGWVAFGASGLVQFFDPINYLPFVNTTFKGASLGRKLYLGARSGAAGAALQEPVLQATQETRTIEESLSNVPASTVFGLAIGGAAHGVERIFSKGANTELGIEGPAQTRVAIADEEIEWSEGLRTRTTAQLVDAGRGVEEATASAEVFTRGVYNILRDIPDASQRRAVMDEINVQVRAGSAVDVEGNAFAQENIPQKWEAVLSSYRRGEVKASGVLKITSLSQPLRDAGLQKREIHLSLSKIDAIQKKHPFMSDRVLSQIGEAIMSPRFILKSGTRDDSLVVVPIRLTNGQTVVVPIRKSSRRGQPHEVLSIYVKENPDWIEDQIKAGRLVYDREAGAGGHRRQPRSYSAYAQQVNADKPRPAPDTEIGVDPDFVNPRGSITMPEGGVLNGQTVISLMETADASTFVHEAAHFFATLIEDIHAKLGPDSPLKARVEALRKEFGDMATTEAQEKFARGFEAYLRLGETPTPEIQTLFDRFREWLVGIYARGEDLGIELTPAMRKVYDDLLVPDISDLPGPYGVSKPQSASAAASGEASILDPETGEYRAAQIDDFAVQTKAGRAVERTGLNLTPNTRINKSPLVSMRRTYANLVADQRDTLASRQGVIGTATETMVQVDRNRANEKIYKILGKRGNRIKHPTLSRDEFGRRILDAIANPADETDGVVLKIANDLSEQVIAPLENQMRRIGMLAETQKWRNDARYAPHNWSAERIYADKERFEKKLQAHIQRALKSGYETEVDRLEQQLSSLYRNIDDLELGASRRMAEVDQRFGGNEVDISEEELRSLLMQAQNKPKEDRPQTLLTWIVRQGGIWKGEPLAAEIQALEYRRPGFLKKERYQHSSAGNNGGGRMLDELRELAVEAGYLDEQATLTDLLDAMDAEMRGKPLYSRSDEYAAQAWEAYDEFIDYLGELGIDPSGRRVLRKTSADQKALIRRTAEALGKLDEKRAAKLRRDAEEMTSEIERMRDAMTDQNEFAQEVQNIVAEVSSKLKGEEDMLTADIDLEINVPGPLKKRTLDVKRSDFSEFMEHDVFASISAHMHRMVAEYHLTKAFGRADMKWDIEAIGAEADLLKSTLSGADEQKLAKQLNDHVKMLKDSRDRIRGTYERQFKGAGNRAARSMSGLAYNVQLGNVMVSSFADVMRPMMTHQLSLIMRHGFPRLREGVQAAFRDLDKLDLKGDRVGAVFERVGNSRLAAMMELDDEYMPRTRPERVINNMAHWATKLSLIDRWNELGKTIVTGLYMDRLGVMSKTAWENLSTADQNYLSINRISQHQWPYVAQAIQQFGTMERGVWKLNLSSWADQDLAMVVRAGMSKEADAMIVTPGVGDKVQSIAGVNMGGPIGRLLLQYKNFWIAGHEKIMLRAAQNPDKAQVASGALAMIVIGMMIDEIKAWSSDPDYSVADSLSYKNIGTRIMGGIDRSGVIPLWMEINNMVERGTSVPGAYAFAGGVSRLFGDDGEVETASRYRNRNVFGSLAGPSAGMTGDALGLIGDVSREVQGKGEGITGSTVSNAFRVMPYHNLPVLREMINWYAKPALQEAVR